jgi:hypothetical protein
MLLPSQWNISILIVAMMFYTMSHQFLFQACAAETQAGGIAFDSEAANTVEGLRSAFEQWKANARFCGTYILRAGFVKDSTRYQELEALQGMLGSDATGLIAVNGALWRHSKVYKLPPEQRDVPSFNNSPVTSMANVSVDEAWNRRLYILYTPKVGEIGGTAQIADLRLRNISLDSGDSVSLSSNFVPNPLEPLLCSGNGMPGEPFPAPDPSSYTVSSKTNDEVTLTVSVKLPTGGGGEQISQEYSVTFLYRYKFPVINRIESTFKSEIAGKPRIQSTLVLIDDFCQAGDYPLGQHIAVIKRGGLVNANKEAIDIARVTHWISHDLAKRMPDEDDFIITVPAGAAIAGLKKESVAKEEMHLSVEEIPDNELAQSGDALAPEPQIQINDGPPKSRLLLFLNAFVLLLVCVLIFSFRWFRSK